VIQRIITIRRTVETRGATRRRRRPRRDRLLRARFAPCSATSSAPGGGGERQSKGETALGSTCPVEETVMAPVTCPQACSSERPCAVSGNICPVLDRRPVLSAHLVFAKAGGEPSPPAGWERYRRVASGRSFFVATSAPPSPRRRGRHSTSTKAWPSEPAEVESKLVSATKPPRSGGRSSPS
jgi:hypothetical protein